MLGVSFQVALFAKSFFPFHFKKDTAAIANANRV